MSGYITQRFRMEGSVGTFTHTYENNTYTYTCIYKYIIYVGIHISNEISEFQYYHLNNITSYSWIFSPEFSMRLTVIENNCITKVSLLMDVSKSQRKK